MHSYPCTKFNAKKAMFPKSQLVFSPKLTQAFIEKANDEVHFMGNETFAFARSSLQSVKASVHALGWHR